MNTAYYYFGNNNEKVFLSGHKLKSSYFLLGYQCKKDTGLLYTMYFQDSKGTTLTPVFLDGDNVRRPEFAGKEVHQTTFKI